MIFHPLERGHVVKARRLAEEQIAHALKQAKPRFEVDEVCHLLASRKSRREAIALLVHSPLAEVHDL